MKAAAEIKDNKASKPEAGEPVRLAYQATLRGFHPGR